MTEGRPDATPPAPCEGGAREPAGRDEELGRGRVRVRLDVAYDGGRFAGWAAQPGLRTVEGTLSDALGTVLRAAPAPRLTVAGRTDAGVHARGQVVHVDVAPRAWAELPGRSTRPPGAALRDRLTGVLPDDVVVRAAGEAPAGFDARFSALHRRYAYRICDEPQRWDPLRRGHVLRQRDPLDVDAMARAAATLLGEHDFAAFCRPREGASTVRTLQVFDVARPQHGEDAGLVVATVQADAFCHSMVRTLVGAMLAVGAGRRGVDWPRAALDAARRDSGATVLPAHGLTLEHVAYPADDELAARARLTRAVRGPVWGRAPGPAGSGGAPAPL